MCKVTVGMYNNLSIDGIICIATQEEEDREIIVKIHEQIHRPPSAENTKITDVVGAANVQQNIKCNQDVAFSGKFIEQPKTPLHTQSLSKDFLLADAESLFSDLAGINAIMPLNRGDPAHMQTTPSVMENTIVNLIDDETIGFEDMAKLTTSPPNEAKMLKPDPGLLNAAETTQALSVPHSASCVVESVYPSQAVTADCTVTSGVQTRPSQPTSSQSSPSQPSQLSNSQPPSSSQISSTLSPALLQHTHIKVHIDESSDDDLKIEKLKAGRTRRHRRLPSESSTSELVEAETLLHSADDSLVNILHLEEEAQITVESSPSKKRRLDIKPIVNRKQIPSSALSSIASKSAPSAQDINYSNIAPSCASAQAADIVRSQTAPPIGKVIGQITSTNSPYNDITSGDNILPPASSSSSSSRSLATKPIMAALKSSGLTVAEQLKLLREHNLIKPKKIKAATPKKMPIDVGLDDILPYLVNLAATYTCPKCTMPALPFREFHLHMYRKHNVFPCPYCEKLFQHRSSRNRHINTHTSPRAFECPVCNKKLTRADSLNFHLKNQHPNEASQFKIHYNYVHGKQFYQADSTAMALSVDKEPVVSTTHTPSNDLISITSAPGATTASKIKKQSTTDQEIVYNRNLPSKFESVDSESSNPVEGLAESQAESQAENQAENQADAQVVSQANPDGLSEQTEPQANPQLSEQDVSEANPQGLSELDDFQLLKMETEEVGREVALALHAMDHDDILDMIEISDDEDGEM